VTPHNATLAVALRGAAEAIAAVLQGHTPEAALDALPATVRPAAMDLTFGTLRDFGRGDFYLRQLIEKPLKEPLIHALLLAALFRLEQRPQEAHTTVDQAVSAAAGIAHGRLKALVNGVLRGFLRRRDELLAAAGEDEVATLRHPAWWMARLRAEQAQDWQAALAAGNSHPPMTLRVNARRGTSSTGTCALQGIPSGHADYCAELAASGIAARRLDAQALLLDKPVAVERLPGFAEGRVSVQDWGAQRAARVLDAGAGMRVLDACAAPGGKSAHLLEVTDVELTALDVDARRTARIAATLQRLGLTADVRTADCRDLGAWWDGRPFERILADVPCSGSGVARRHPDIKWLRRESDVAQFASTQSEILDAVWRVLAPGGKMLYCTCSVFRAENADQIDAFAARHADVRRLPTDGQDHEHQLLPGPEHDGFYYALLQKVV
jgi:16S rRNA (cytosine967-C5)-methyltransferase